MVARSLFHLFCAHISMISQPLEAINLHPYLAPNATQEIIEHFKVKASAGRVPEELV